MAIGELGRLLLSVFYNYLSFMSDYRKVMLQVFLKIHNLSCFAPFDMLKYHRLSNRIGEERWILLNC